MHFQGVEIVEEKNVVPFLKLQYFEGPSRPNRTSMGSLEQAQIIITN